MNELPRLSKTEMMEPEPSISRVQEYPLLSLGYHNLLAKAREKLASIAELPNMNDIIKSLHSYFIENEDEYSLELIETLQEGFYFSNDIPKTATMIGPESKLPFVVSFLPGKKKMSVKFLPPSIKMITSKMKKSTAKPSDLIVVTGISDPIVSLILGLYCNTKYVCVKLTDYVLTTSVLKLVSMYCEKFNHVYLYRPLAASPYQARASVFLIARERLSNMDATFQVLVDKATALSDKECLIDLFPEYKVSDNMVERILEINMTMISKDISALNDLYRFVKAKDFYGADMENYVSQQKRLTNEWKEKYNYMV